MVAFSSEEVYAIAELLRRQRGGAAVRIEISREDAINAVDIEIGVRTEQEEAA